MKKLLSLFPLLCLPLFAAQPNVPLYVRWDGTVAAPTQFLSAVFKAGGNITLTDNRTNLTITATGVSLASSIVTNLTVISNFYSPTISYFNTVVITNALFQTNITLSPTNLIAGREIWVFCQAANGNYDVTITNTAATAIHWNLNSSTNGSTSFTVTNGQSVELAILCRTNNVLNAVYGHYR